MNARTIALISCVSLALTPWAQARLGESQEQIQKRYGKPVSVNKPQGIAVYRSDGQYVRVEFAADKAAMMAYRKAPFEAMTDREIAGILARHAGTGEWTALPGTPGHRHWQTADGAHIARYSVVNGLLIITTPAYRTRQLDRKTPNWRPSR